MEFKLDTVLDILSFIRKQSERHGGYGLLISFYYCEIPGERSNQEVAFFLEYCRDKGYVEGDLSADKIMAIVRLTPAGLIYLQELMG